jgi:hypothetical protein
MHYNYYYRPYPYYRRYYDLNPYYYGRYYPFYNVVDSQVSDVDQSIINYGDMIDVIQDADVYQSMSPAPEENNHTESTIVVTEESEDEEETELGTSSMLILP